MIEMSAVAAEISGLLHAKGWETRTEGCRIETTEPSLDETQHIWLAGKPSELSYELVRRTGATRIITHDHATRAERTRLTNAPGSPILSSRSRFIDRLWNASAAADFARHDGEVPDIDFGGDLSFEEDPFRRHVDQSIFLGDREVKDWKLVEEAVASTRTKAAILADAGCGKSELLKLIAWGIAVRYLAVASASDEPSLPTVAVRVHLRGMRTFDLDSIAGRLREDTARGRKRLGVQVENGHVLRQLMILGRVILLLDGLDELQVTREELERGLRLFGSAVLEGGRVIVSSRAGHFLSATSIRQRFEAHEVARIPPFGEYEARQLLHNYGATASEAADILDALGTKSPAVGVPLFLLMALSAHLTEPVDADIAESRTRVLLLLIEKFCKRDEDRIGLPSDVQLRMLTELAYWISLEGPLEPATALEIVGLQDGDDGAGLITHPHALLAKRKDDGRIECKFPQVQALLAAKSNVDSARSGDWSSVVREWRTVRLDSMTTEYLARLMTEDEVRSVWTASDADAAERPSGLARRNVLAIALAKLNDVADSESPQKRSHVLERIIGSKSLAATQLQGLSLEKFDFEGWDLRRLDGRGGAIRFCDNLSSAVTDDTLLTLDALEGCDVRSNQAEVDRRRLSKGIKRLDRALDGWLDRRSATLRLVPRRSLADAGYSNEWAVLRRKGFATSQRKEHGTRYWILSQERSDLLLRFVELRPHPDRVKHCDSSAELRDLLIELGR